MTLANTSPRREKVMASIAPAPKASTSASRRASRRGYSLSGGTKATVALTLAGAAAGVRMAVAMAIDPNEEHLRVNGGRYGSSEICDLYVDFVRPGQGTLGQATATARRPLCSSSPADSARPRLNPPGELVELFQERRRLLVAHLLDVERVVARRRGEDQLVELQLDRL